MEYSERARAEVRARQNNSRQSKLWVNLMRFHCWIILVRPKLISENPFEKSVKSLILETIESINVELEHSTWKESIILSSKPIHNSFFQSHHCFFFTSRNVVFETFSSS